MQLCVAGLTGDLRLEGAPPALRAKIMARLGGYAAEERGTFPPPVVELGVTVVSDRPRPDNPSGGFIPPVVRATGRQLHIERWDFTARLQRSTPEAPWQGEASCLGSPYIFESLCRVLWSLLLPRRGAAFFHGCGISLADGGPRAILAAGPSGAGKTTLARKVPAATDVLSDEMVAVTRLPEGWHLESTPFFGEFPPASLTPRRLPLAGIAFLEQQPHVAATALGAGDAAFNAIGCLMSWEEDEEGVRRLFDLVTSLTAEVPSLRCASRVDTPFSEILAAMAPLLSVGVGVSAPAGPRRDILGGNGEL